MRQSRLLKKLIADLESISQDGTTCSDYIIDGQEILSSWMEPIDAVAKDLVGSSDDLLQVFQPITDVADAVLALFEEIPFFGVAAYQAVKYILRVDLVVKQLESLLIEFGNGFTAVTEVINFVIESFSAVATILVAGADAALSSSVVASSVVACCDNIPIVNFICHMFIDGFAQNENVGPRVTEASETIAICPNTLEAVFSILPNLDILETLRNSFRDIIAVVQPFVDEVLKVLGIYQGAPVQQAFAFAVGCETTNAIIAPMANLLENILPGLTVVFESQTFSFKLPTVDFADGIQKNEFTCTFDDWQIEFEIKEYNFTLPGLSFPPIVQEVLEGPDPYEGKTLAEDISEESACSVVKFEEEWMDYFG